MISENVYSESVNIFIMHLLCSQLHVCLFVFPFFFLLNHIKWLIMAKYIFSKTYQ